jgi:hypothetical protein
MTKRKRQGRSAPKLGAKNKLEGSTSGELINIDPPPNDAPALVQASHFTALRRSTLFSAEFEAVIEIIARDRVYRAMVARFARRLPAPDASNSDPAA